MKKTIFSLVIIFLLLVINFSNISAHEKRQLSYFKINEKYSNLYPVSVSSIPELQLPEDSAPENYLVNEPITFEIDNAVLKIPEESLKNTDFVWNFGDGIKATGLKNTHIYATPGQYILAITATYNGTQIAQLSHTTLITILSAENYRIPEVRIFVNEKGVSDPIAEFLELDLRKEVTFSVTVEGSSPPYSYLWDFEDGTSSKELSVKHLYYGKNSGAQKSIYFPAIRVRDSQGFYTDTFIQINHQEDTLVPKSNLIMYGILGIGGIVSVVLFFRLRKNRKLQ